MEVRGLVTVIDVEPWARVIDAEILVLPSPTISAIPWLPALLLTVAAEVSDELQAADCVTSLVDPSL